MTNLMVSVKAPWSVAGALIVALGEGVVLAAEMLCPREHLTDRELAAVRQMLRERAHPTRGSCA